MHLQWEGLSRPFSRHDSTHAPGGGVGFIAVNSRSVFLIRLSAYPKGALSVLATSRRGHVAIIGVYLPPKSSRYAHYAPDIMTWVRGEYARLSDLGHRVVVVGDFNRGYGVPDGSGRLADDKRTSRGQSEMLALCQAVDISPLHGRVALARRTSLPIAGVNLDDVGSRGAESDYFLASTDLQPNDYTTDMPSSWVRPDGVSHYLLTAGIIARPPLQRKSGDPPPGARAPRSDDGPHRHYYPDYRDALWNAFAMTLDNNLGTVGGKSLTSFAHALSRTLDTHFSHPTTDMRGTVHRRFQCINLPARIVEMYAAARLARTRVRERRRDGHADDPETTSLQQLAISTQRSATKEARRCMRAWHESRVRDLQSRRRVDAHGMFRIVELLSPGPDGLGGGSSTHIPDGPDGKNAADRFYDHFSVLTRETRVQAVEKEARFMDLLHAVDGSHLAAPIT